MDSAAGMPWKQAAAQRADGNQVGTNPYPSLEDREAKPTLSSGLERRADEGEKENAEWD